MRRFPSTSCVLAFIIGLASAGCTGSGSGVESSATPAAPSSSGSATPATTTTSSSAGSSTTITIVGSVGSQAFTPNPVQGVASGQTVVFDNRDLSLHHIVMDDNSADSGDIAPGATKPLVLRAASGTYHCTIHPSMVGSINLASAPASGTGSADPGY